jgi:hypothetical protein
LICSAALAGGGYARIAGLLACVFIPLLLRTRGHGAHEIADISFGIMLWVVISATGLYISRNVALTFRVPTLALPISYLSLGGIASLIGYEGQKTGVARLSLTSVK